jgi:hypothetical protein
MDTASKINDLQHQSEIAARDGVTLDRASMGRWIGLIVELCMVLVEAIRRYTLADGKLHTDDTTVPILTPGNQKTTTGRFWVYVRDDRRSGSTAPAAVWFSFSSDRKGIHTQSTSPTSRESRKRMPIAVSTSCTRTATSTKRRAGIMRGGIITMFTCARRLRIPRNCLR